MRFKWSGLFVLISCLAAPAFGQIQVVGEPVQPPPKPKYVIKDLTISPAPEAIPALKYKFWGDSLRTNPDNAAVHILRAIIEYEDVAHSGDSQSKWHQQYGEKETRLQDFPVEAARESLKPYSHMFEELYHANRSQRIDYDFRLYHSVKQSLFTARLNELTIIHQFGRLLARQARLAIVEKRYDDAIETLQTGFRIGEISPIVGGNTLLSKLTGIAVHTAMLEEIKLFIQQPDAPNLYWALASLPDEIGNLRDALEGESIGIDNELSSIMYLPEESISDQAWRVRIESALSDVLALQERPSHFSRQPAYLKLNAGNLILAYGESSKAYLIDQGNDAQQVEQMSYSEAIVRAARKELTIIKSDVLKWAFMPNDYESERFQGNPFLNQAPFTPGKMLAQTFLPAVINARLSGTRVLTLRNQLVTAEAIRAHLATHDGKLPATLEDLSPLPAWKQILGAAPFEYRTNGNDDVVLLNKPVAAYDSNSELHLAVAKSNKP